MKPYLAVLYDSFLESVRSRVLWILLGSWVLILLALFPLSLKSGESYRIARYNFQNNGAKTVMDALADASGGKGSRAQRAIYPKLSEEFQTVLKQRKENGRRISVGTLTDEFNRLLSSKDLYNAEAWPTAVRRKELKEIIDKENRSEAETEKLNRKLLELAFPNALSSSGGQATAITYLGITLGSPLPMPIDLVKNLAERAVFPLIMRYGLGLAALLISIVITSPMIPDMFQTGSLHLLLSKPLSRSLLFLTKFLGGCIFVALNMSFLISGLYVYSGIQLGIWNNGILWYIPLFIFIFIVYYSVSALAGLIWKNPIICVVVTALFWGICMAVGTIHFFFDINLNINPQTKQIYAFRDTVVTSNQQGRILFWNGEDRTWNTAYGDGGGQQILGPVWIDSTKSLYFGRTEVIPFGFGGRGSVSLEVARLPDLVDPEDKTYQSKPWADGRLDSVGEMPPSPIQIVPWQNTLAVFNDDGLFVFDPSINVFDEKQLPGIGSVLKSFGLGTKNIVSAFKPVLTGLELLKPFDLNVSPTSQTVVAISKGELRIWKQKDDRLELMGTLTLEMDKDAATVIGCNDEYALVCPNGEQPIVVEIQSQKAVRTLEEMGQCSVKQVRVDSTGGFAILDRERKVWVANRQLAEIRTPSLPGQFNALAIGFDSADQLWVAHTVKQADRWDLKEGKSTQSIRPKLTTLEYVFYYFVHPFYFVNPKPAAVNETIDHMLENPKNKSLALDRRDLEMPTEKSDPWQPLWSNAIFIAVMLAISCWLLYRQDL